MKKTDVNKLYDKLNSNELARLTFEALCNQDGETAGVIVDNVKRNTYVCVDTDYKHTLDKLFDVASIWGIEYWRCYAKMLAAIGQASLLREGDGDGDESERIRAYELEFLWEGRLIALGVILNTLETTHKVDRASITKYSNTGVVYGLDYELELLDGDALEYYESMLGEMTALLDGTEAAKSGVSTAH